MDAHSLAQSPAGIFSLVICGVVAAYTFTALMRALLGQLSSAATGSEADQSELLTVDLSHKFRQQLSTLLDRVELLTNLAGELPGPFSDTSWQRLLNSCEALQHADQRLMGLLHKRDFVDGLPLAQFLSGTKVAVPNLKQPLSEQQLPLIVQWHSKTTELLQRMVAKIEDAAHHHHSPDTPPLSQEFFASLAKLRKGIIKDEQRYSGR